MGILEDSKRTGFEFRKAFTSDAIAIDDLRHKAIEAVVSNAELNKFVDIRQAYDWHQKDSLDRIRTFISSERQYTEMLKEWQKLDETAKSKSKKPEEPHHVEVAVDVTTDKIVGYSIIRGNELERMFVDPEYQGRHIGKQLLERAEDYIKAYQLKRGMPPIAKVDSFVTSRQFYAKNGYIPSFARRFELDQSTIFTYWMLKNLDGEPIREDMESLADARDAIDEIDHEIITLITRRFAVTQWVGELKANETKPAYDGVREEKQRDVISAWASMYGMPDWLMQAIFGIIREESRKNHREIRESEHFNKTALNTHSTDN